MIDTIKAQIRWESMPIKSNAERLKEIDNEVEKLLNRLCFLDQSRKDIRAEIEHAARGRGV